jgi:hypothetical protein
MKTPELALVTLWKRQDKTGQWWVRAVVEGHQDKVCGPFETEQKANEEIAAIKCETEFISLMDKGGSA